MHQKMEELSSIEAGIEKINWFQTDLDHEVDVQSSREKEL